MILEENGFGLLGFADDVDMNADATLRAIYTVPVGKIHYPVAILIHEVSATLAGCDDVDFGGGAACITPGWRETITELAGLTAAGDSAWIFSNLAINTPCGGVDGDDATAADRIFGILLVEGSTDAATASFKVFGFQEDS